MWGRTAVVALMVACGGGEESLPPEVEAQAEPEPELITTYVHHVGEAHFGERVLTSCVDRESTFTFEPRTPEDAAAAAEEFYISRRDAERARLEEQGFAPEPVTRIDSRCSVAFADRSAVATCTMTRSQEGVSRVIVNNYYQVGDIANDDGLMRTCMELRGQWWAMPRDSAEYRRLVAEHELRRLEEQAGRR